MAQKLLKKSPKIGDNSQKMRDKNTKKLLNQVRLLKLKLYWNRQEKIQEGFKAFRIIF